jgi:hypothetical protein
MALGIEQLINRAQVTIYPVETVGASQTLWKARTTLRIPAGGERVIYAPFRDDNGERVGAVDVVEPVATTDYRVFEFSDGGGVEYTTDPAFSIDTEIEATRARITLGNTAIGNLYMTLLQIRGKPIRVWDPITLEEEDTSSQSAYEKRAAALDLPMQADPVFARSYAEYLIGRFAVPFLAADRALIRDRDVTGNVNVFSLDLLDKIVVSDAQTGASSLQHWIRAVEVDLSPQTFAVTLHLERADDRQYWLLGKSGYSDLGTNTRLGF